MNNIRICIFISMLPFCVIAMDKHHSEKPLSFNGTLDLQGTLKPSAFLTTGSSLKPSSLNVQGTLKPSAFITAESSTNPSTFLGSDAPLKPSPRLPLHPTVITNNAAATTASVKKVQTRAEFNKECAQNRTVSNAAIRQAIQEAESVCALRDEIIGNFTAENQILNDEYNQLSLETMNIILKLSREPSDENQKKIAENNKRMDQIGLEIAQLRAKTEASLNASK